MTARRRRTARSSASPGPTRRARATRRFRPRSRDRAGHRRRARRDRPPVQRAGRRNDGAGRAAARRVELASRNGQATPATGGRPPAGRARVTRPTSPHRDPADRLGFADKDDGTALAPTSSGVALDDLHDRLWAEARRSVVLVLQGMDAAGKDGTIRRVLTGLNPQGCSVVNFKAPTDDRPRPRLPLARPRRRRRREGSSGSGTGRTTRTSSPPACIGVIDDERCRNRYRHIREFERMLADEGITDGEGLPPPLQGGAAGPPAGPDRRPEEELEVPADRPRHPRALGRVPGALRARRSPRPRPRSGRRGTSSPPTTSGCGTSRSPRCWSTCCGSSTRRSRLRRRVWKASWWSSSPQFRIRLVRAALHRPKWVLDGRRVA